MAKEMIIPLAHPCENICDHALQSRVDCKVLGYADLPPNRRSGAMSFVHLSAQSALKCKEVTSHGSLNATTPRSNGPFNFSRIIEFHQPPHFDEELHPPPYSGRRGSFGGRGMPRNFEEVPRPQARHGEPLYDNHEHVPFVANHGRDQGDQTLDRMKWKLPSFKGENDPNIFLDWERQVENMFMLKICNKFLKARLVIAEFSGYALHW
ncbi:hypothetical protein M9H77_21601 [Catharanthus roseus]|uniref:Uncharacterized protein n=1 Tax=Catharanthus roseus TaxID=4058 RepID=A0ACC0AMT2_CATRO|nr:hypothetical protein M9H77_21601 [Catharanthus roseus]